MNTEAIVEIQQAIAAYNHCVDFGDGVGFAALFTDDGVLDMGHTRIQGRAALAEFANGVKDRVPNPRHVVTNSWIQVDSDTATARSYGQVFTTPPGETTVLKSAGGYEDDLVVVDGAWRFRERRWRADPSGGA